MTKTWYIPTIPLDQPPTSFRHLFRVNSPFKLRRRLGFVPASPFSFLIDKIHYNFWQQYSNIHDIGRKRSILSTTQIRKTKITRYILAPLQLMSTYYKTCIIHPINLVTMWNDHLIIRLYNAITTLLLIISWNNIVLTIITALYAGSVYHVLH